jgi:glycosyltransferase involved in cell wall biosynthesis
VIGDAGLTFPADNVTGLRDCLARLLDDLTLPQQLADAGHRRVAHHYSQRVLAQQTAAVYRSL